MRSGRLVTLVLAMASNLGSAQQPATPPDANQPIYSVGVDGVTAPVPVEQPAAQFPPEALEKLLNGKCSASVTVDAKGNPQNTQIVRCTDPVFVHSTLVAVAQYRFKPATTRDGKPVPVRILIETAYRLKGRTLSGREPSAQVSYGLRVAQGATSSTPDADGVYQLTEAVVPPRMTLFTDVGYGNAAFDLPGSSPCDVLLTIDAKGNAYDPRVIHCEKPTLDQPSAQSLLKSHYKPGSVNGKSVAVRVTIHLEFDGFAYSK